jgi:hypothetical protein
MSKAYKCNRCQGHFDGSPTMQLAAPSGIMVCAIRLMGEETALGLRELESIDFCDECSKGMLEEALSTKTVVSAHVSLHALLKERKTEDVVDAVQPAEWITIKQAALMMGLSYDGTRRCAVEYGDIIYRRIGRFIELRKDSVQALAAKRVVENTTS